MTPLNPTSSILHSRCVTPVREALLDVHHDDPAPSQSSLRSGPRFLGLWCLMSLRLLSLYDLVMNALYKNHGAILDGSNIFMTSTLWHCDSLLRSRVSHHDVTPSIASSKFETTSYCITLLSQHRLCYDPLLRSRASRRLTFNSSSPQPMSSWHNCCDPLLRSRASHCYDLLVRLGRLYVNAWRDVLQPS